MEKYIIADFSNPLSHHFQNHKHHILYSCDIQSTPPHSSPLDRLHSSPNIRLHQPVHRSSLSIEASHMFPLLSGMNPFSLKELNHPWRFSNVPETHLFSASSRNQGGHNALPTLRINYELAVIILITAKSANSFRHTFQMERIVRNIYANLLQMLFYFCFIRRPKKLWN